MFRFAKFTHIKIDRVYAAIILFHCLTIQWLIRMVTASLAFFYLITIVTTAAEKLLILKNDK